MNYITSFLFLLSSFTLPAQSINLGGSTTRAVVVGISDYQDPLIPDLRFADRDAVAFANFLRSPAGGTLDGDHLKLLIDSQATVAQFAIALDWLIENSKEGDQAIIYFSGHGDVEKKTLTQPGFLLCWDAPARVYMAGGAFNLRDVQEIVSTLSIQNKSKVVVITDACRSGTLAGNSVGGAQATAANLAKQYANEIKILSCQPNEYSIEGEQWGGGRGAFSFNLVEALYGMADANKDLSVTLQEVGRYLEDHVTPEVAPVSQIPKVVGNPTERLSTVDANLLAAISSGRTNQMQMLSPIDTRGLEDDVMASVDTTIRELYRLFNKALKAKVFLEPATACADAYYERLMAEPKLARLHSTMRRNYAAALQDDAQQVMNGWLKADMSEYVLSKRTQTKKYQPYSQYLERAAQLLGENHYMYPVLQARRHFFNGYLLALSNRNPDKELANKALAQFREALSWQSELPQVYWQMGLVYGYNLHEIDSADYYVQQAITLNPKWVIPLCDASWMSWWTTRDLDRSKSYLEQVKRIDSTSVIGWEYWGAYYTLTDQYIEAERMFLKLTLMETYAGLGWNDLGWLYGRLGRYQEAELALKKTIQLDSTYSGAYINLGNVYFSLQSYSEAEQQFKKAIHIDSTSLFALNMLGRVYKDTRRYVEAEQLFKKTIQLDSTFLFAYIMLGNVYNLTRQYAEAEQQFKKIILLDSTYVTAYSMLGYVYNVTGRYDEAEQQFKKAIHIDSNSSAAWYHLACYHGLQNHTDKAYNTLELALQKGFKNFALIQEIPALAPLRERAEQWDALMKKYFPDQAKD